MIHFFTFEYNQIIEDLLKKLTLLRKLQFFFFKLFFYFLLFFWLSGLHLHLHLLIMQTILYIHTYKWKDKINILKKSHDILWIGRFSWSFCLNRNGTIAQKSRQSQWCSGGFHLCEKLPSSHNWDGKRGNREMGGGAGDMTFHMR